ncbi:MAG: M15 family metallopeptidase [Flavobacteriales bacterium]|jgi:D-alanyl-D-alanine dipeptidase
MRLNITIRLVAVSLIALPTLSFSQQPSASSVVRDSISRFSDSTLVLIPLDSLQIVNQIKYATKDNFLHQPIYPCAKCYLRKEAALALIAINEDALAKGYRLVIFDCYRPFSDQLKMFSLLPDERYVADPNKGASNHNKGIAVDISLATLEGDLLPMGSAFDEFSEKSHLSYKGLTEAEQANRKTLQTLMISGGFMPYDHEWWHFSYKNKVHSVLNFTWDCD